MRAIVVAGGTGGHIYPAIAIINKIKEKEQESEILYIGTTDRMEKDIIPNLGINYIGLEMSGLNRKNIFKNLEVLKKYKKAITDAKREIKKFDPDVVIGVGGYITLPVLTAANSLGYKTIIHEQNSIPGLSNKMLARFTDCVCVSLPNSVKLFKNKNVVYTGNPRSEEIIDVAKVTKKDLGLDSTKKLVIIVMGSLGSLTMTNKLKEIITGFSGKKYQVIVVTGKGYFDNYKDLKIPGNVRIVPYMDNLINVMKDTDLLVSRAGASTIAEITAIGLPAILVPSPYVTHNHQYMNAKELEDLGACRIVTEEDFSKETIIKEIDNLLNDSKTYVEMREASKKLGVVDSATRIYTEIRKLIG
ncbi:MAG: undecaprenyldiphospho-muramoylpentapeptide beta-N-acetylglucosaminyltransferase [Mycoplasmatota bacterium]|nr:undecaprenyldiphospho-muramoylpentapeptide beta-N-acetylglucosaminyltransferase [Mycoplasmatota bacterium]